VGCSGVNHAKGARGVRRDVPRDDHNDYGVESSNELMHGQVHEVANRIQAKMFARTGAAKAKAEAATGEGTSVGTDAHDVATDAELVEPDTGSGAA
jgi:hypothetical protein